MRQATPPPPPAATATGPDGGRGDRTDRGAYLAFRQMITPSFVRTLYAAGMLLLVVCGVLLIVQGIQLREFGGYQMILWGLAILLPGNLLWRVLCEQVVILHRIHEDLMELRSGARAQRAGPYDDPGI